ncbi:MAG: class I SAM-dependent methyltransferase [Armatimonadota bacterium]|nr:MAG: class I SAM-dependent methyltransferase [Armatimonadota bacterium]
MAQDEITRKVEECWDRGVEEGDPCTRPLLDLTREMIEEYAAGRRDELPGVGMEPRYLLEGAEGKDVLCLASGGGQQSAVFGLLGANVTVLDISAGQLRGDRTAAEHYGYQVRTVKGDMRDLSIFEEASFDLVYQPASIAYVPDVRPVYREVHRVLRPGGLYSVGHTNPAVHSLSLGFCGSEGGAGGWDGAGYRIVDRYRGGAVLRNEAGVANMEEGEPTGEHCHLLKDIFGGLTELGFIISDVAEDPRHLKEPITGKPGSYEHMLYFVALYFNIVAEKA